MIPGCPDKMTKVGKDLPEILKQEIIYLIREYLDIFAWGPNDMPGIPEIIARDSLHFNPKIHPIFVRRKGSSQMRNASLSIKRLIDCWRPSSLNA